MVGIILAGGTGSRYYPNTIITSKHLLPLYNKPIIYYPLALLMEANIKEIVLIVSEQHFTQYTEMLGDGSNYGIILHYVIQKQPLGTAHALSLVEDYIKDRYCVLAYGDNYINSDVINTFLRSNPRKTGATIFGYKVDNPRDYGVIELSAEGKVISLEEKPRFPKSNYAMIGLIYFDSSVCDRLKKTTLSKRKEYEITDVLNDYLRDNELTAVLLEEDAEWSDLGNAKSVTYWSNRIMIDEQTKGIYKGYLEAIALRNKWLEPEVIRSKMIKHHKSHYGQVVLADLNYECEENNND